MVNNLLNKADYAEDIFFIILGSFISSIGVNMFIVHAKLLSGGVTAIALIIQYLLKIQAGFIIIILNIPLFILSYFKLNKKFTIYSIVGTLSLSISLILTNPIGNILHLNDILLFSLYGGVFNGIGFGLVFSHGGSTGGFDIISMLIRKKYCNYDLGKISFSINFVIIFVSSFIFGVSSALYTIVSIYTSTLVLDKVVKGLNRRKIVFIITNKEAEISKQIMANLKRGVTWLYGEGAYTKEQKKVLFCIISLSQLPELKAIVKSVDGRSFVTIIDASEVEGMGFVNRI